MGAAGNGVGLLWCCWPASLRCPNYFPDVETIPNFTDSGWQLVSWVGRTLVCAIDEPLTFAPTAFVESIAPDLFVRQSLAITMETSTGRLTVHAHCLCSCVSRTLDIMLGPPDMRHGSAGMHPPTSFLFWTLTTGMPSDPAIQKRVWHLRNLLGAGRVSFGHCPNPWSHLCVSVYVPVQQKGACLQGTSINGRFGHCVLPGVTA